MEFGLHEPSTLIYYVILAGSSHVLQLSPFTETLDIGRVVKAHSFDGRRLKGFHSNEECKHNKGDRKVDYRSDIKSTVLDANLPSDSSNLN